MSKDTKEKDEESSLSIKNWSYDGKEEEWNAFDRRMQRYMRAENLEYSEKTYGWVWFRTLLDLDQLSTTNIVIAFGLRLTALTRCKRENYGILHLGSGPLPISECGLKDS